MGVHYPFGLSKGKYLNYVRALLLWFVEVLVEVSATTKNSPRVSLEGCVYKVFVCLFK
jgi:hypothetical protein